MPPTKELDSSELDALAFEIFSKRVAAKPANRGGEREAIDSYRQAEQFLAIRNKVRGGELKGKAAEGPQLADVFAPNRPRTDPYNMVSQRFGDLETVNRVAKWLDANPTPESDPLEIVHRFKAAFHELQWGATDGDVLSSIKVARVVFPAYAKK